MDFANDGNRHAAVPKLNGFLDLGAVGTVKPLIITDDAHHQIVNLFADRATDQPASLDDQRLIIFAGALGHHTGEQKTRSAQLNDGGRGVIEEEALRPRRGCCAPTGRPANWCSISSNSNDSSASRTPSLCMSTGRL